MSKKTNRVGERFITEEHLGKYEIIIVEYNDCKNILVEFQDKHKAIVHTSYKDCCRGKEEYIKQIADEYKDKIPYDLYMALYSWEIEEGD